MVREKLPFMGGDGQSKDEQSKDGLGYEKLVKEPEEGFKMVRRNWAVQAVEHFFKYNINPNFIRARRERAKAEAKREADKTDYGKWAIIFTIIIIGAALAYYIFSQGGGGAASSVTKAGSQVVKGTEIG